jgi:GR25 family glycosyltransferase involved in LPS biosynthesis
MNNLKIFVIHYTKNTDRKKFLSKMFKKENIENPIWIVEYDREQVLYEDYRNAFNVTETVFNHRQPAQFPWGLHKLKSEEVSVALKHKLALEYSISLDEEYYLILEDDIILEENFLQKLNNYMNEIPKDWDVAFIGQAVDKRISSEELIDGVYWYKKEWPADKCADSYLIKKSAAYKILSGMNNHGICFPIDHELSYWFRTFKMNVYWLEPPITAQGSQCGIFKTFQDFHSQYHNENFKNIRSDLSELLNDE